MDLDTDAALGPPAKLRERREDLTPMLRQYVEVCERYDDALVLFRVGDFYKSFCEAARVVARICELTLIEREDSTGTYDACGIPVDNAESYLRSLLDADFRIAIADQIEDPNEVAGVVDRAVTRVLTPGTVTEDELLEGEDHTFVAAVTGGDAHGLALIDVSTGDFVATGADAETVIAEELGRFAPSEAIVGPDAPTDVVPDGCAVSPYDPGAFEPERARETLSAYFGDPDRLVASRAEVRACGALLSYAEYARGGGDGRLDYLNHLVRYDPREYMTLDAVAIDSLELFEPRSVHGDDEATLAGVLDRTASAPGSRRLRDWLRRPLVDRDRIERRLDAVGELKRDPALREALHDRLRDVYDLERLISRISRERADARDLRSLKDTLDLVPEIREELAGAEADRLREIHSSLDGLADVRDLIDDAIREDPATEITEGGLIAEGYDDRLDDLRATEREGKEWIADLEERERERTGIDSLEVGHTSVHGYYIEVTDANLDRVPDDYRRRQTLKNSERFVTPELKEREDEIVNAEQRADDLEYELFTEVRSAVGDHTRRVQAVADALADLDALAALATAAATHDYARPTFDGEGFQVRDGRHPVVERTREEFVPNGIDLGADARVAIVTGPNMSGKSTYMRQLALIVVMAQMGGFVPAREASLDVVDRIFTRIGASDDIAGGRSTFMVEMTELATILDAATGDSLVLLDEVGRGTSTTDGLAIARAVTEYVHDEVGATTLFATHHHELTGMADRLDGVVNYHFDATTREDGTVEFDHEVAPGAATASYGVEVASTAGIPDPVVERADELLDEEAAGGGNDPASEARATDAAADVGAGIADGGVGAGTDGDLEAVRDRLESLSLADTTPLEALQVLDDLKRELD